MLPSISHPLTPLSARAPRCSSDRAGGAKGAGIERVSLQDNGLLELGTPSGLSFDDGPGVWGQGCG